MQDSYTTTLDARSVAESSVETRAAFLIKTYAHLLGAILAFTAVQVALYTSGLSVAWAQPMLENWWIVLGGFVLVSWLASNVAHRAATLPMQYLALGGFVAAESLIFAPLIGIAAAYRQDALSHAAGVTVFLFGLLTAVVFFTRKDFSFLRGALTFMGVGAMILIVASLVFGFTLGTWFTVGMIVFACLSILWDTSKVMLHYPEDRYVGASLELFASFALLLWYVLRLFMSRD